MFKVLSYFWARATGRLLFIYLLNKYLTRGIYDTVVISCYNLKRKKSELIEIQKILKQNKFYRHTLHRIDDDSPII